MTVHDRIKNLAMTKTQDVGLFVFSNKIQHLFRAAAPKVEGSYRNQ